MKGPGLLTGRPMADQAAATPGGRAWSHDSLPPPAPPRGGGMLTGLVAGLAGFLIGALGTALLALGLWHVFGSGARTSIDAQQPAVIKEVQSLGRLQTVAFNLEKVIDARSQGQWLPGLLSQVLPPGLTQDRVLLVMAGRVTAGVDLAGVGPDQVRVDGKALRLRLPAASLFEVEVDEQHTYVYDRTTGLLAPTNRQLESQARQAGEQKLRQAACQGEILAQAKANAQSQLHALFTAAGFTAVTLDMPDGSCAG